MRPWGFTFKVTIPLALLAACLGPSDALAQGADSVVCRKEAIYGYDQEKARASSFLSSGNTSDIRKCEVYVTRRDGSLYLQSNFLTPGYENPTKLAVEYGNNLDYKDLEFLLANLIFADEPGFLEGQRFRTAVENDIRVYLDESIFDTSDQVVIDTGSVSNLYFIPKDSATPRKAMRLNSARGPPKWIAAWSENFFYEIKVGADPSPLFERLSATPFRRGDFSFVSLFGDRKVVQEILNTELGRHEQRLETISLDALHQVLRASRGKVLGLLGHINEDGEFEARSTDGREVLLRVSVSDLERMAAENDCHIIHLGCTSAGTFNSSPEVGTTASFNPLLMVKRLNQALSSNTMADFLNTLAANDLGLVFGQHAFDGFGVGRGGREGDAGGGDGSSGGGDGSPGGGSGSTRFTVFPKSGDGRLIGIPLGLIGLSKTSGDDWTWIYLVGVSGFTVGGVVLYARRRRAKR